MASEDVTRMVLSFFLQQEYYRALIALEQDSKVRLWSHGKEIDFFYDLITEGKFEDVERLVETVKEKSTLAHSRIIGYIRKEKFMEALEGNVLPEAQDLATALKDIEGLLPRDEYEALCSVLTAENRAQQDSLRWDIWKGRYMCFQDCLKCLQELYTINPPVQKPRSLLTLLNNMSEEGAFSDRSKPNRQPKESNRYSSDSSLEAVSPATDPRPVLPERRSPRPRDLVPADSHFSHIDQEARTPQNLMDRMDPAKVREMARVTDTQVIRAAGFSPDGDWYALGTKSKSMRIYSLREVVEAVIEGKGGTGTIEQKFSVEIDNLHQGSIYCTDWSRSGAQIATGSNDKTICIFTPPNLDRALSEPMIARAVRDSPDLHIRTIPNLPGTVRSLCFHSQDDSTLFSSGDGEGEILVWQTETLQLVRRFAGHPGGTVSLAVAGDASFLLSGGQDRYLRMWDLRTCNCIRQINAEIFGDVTCIALNCASPSTLPVLLAAAHSDGVVSVWDLTTAQLFSKHNFHRESCRAVNFSCNAQWLASASFDQSIGLTSLESGESYRIQEHAGKVVSVHWHPKLPLVLSTSTDKTARVFRIGN